MTKRVVIMVIDGLRSDALATGWLPSLGRVSEESRFFSGHRGVFPSATRVSSASMATGCYPARHGLAGNAIAWTEGDQGFVRVSVGAAEFVSRWRERMGHTLKMPTLADRLGAEMLIFSNSSAGAAHMQDPNRQARFFHRSGSWRPGGASVTAAEALEVTYDGTGDAITTARFCDTLLRGEPATVSLLWICEPDHTQHTIALGSPDHRAILAGSDRMVAQVHFAVERLRQRGDDVLFLICSDHGQETTDQIIDVEAELVAAGFKQSADSTETLVVSSGMGALVYALDESTERAHAMAEWMRAQSWCRDAWSGNTLAQIGQQAGGGLVAAFAMARSEEPNQYGVAGRAHVVKDPFSPKDATGHGQHGGMGPFEGSPLLLANGTGFSVGVEQRASGLVDIAPTALTHLGLNVGDVDGTPLFDRGA